MLAFYVFVFLVPVSVSSAADVVIRQVDPLSTATYNCSLAPTACYLSTPYPVALRAGLDCTYNFQCLSNNCSTTLKCGTSPLGGNCLEITDCVTQNCSQTICAYRIIPVGGGCLLDQECIGYPANICDPTIKQCRIKAGGECTSSADCVSGATCQALVCDPGSTCGNQLFCVA